MIPQTIFIIDKKKNILIFLGLLDKDILLRQEELSEVLGSILSHSSYLKLNSCSTIQINDKNYFLGNFKKLIIITQNSKSNHTPKEFLIELYNIFLNKYSDTLENYSDKDIIMFKPFVDNIKEIMPKYFNSKKREKKISPTIPIIEPMKREPFLHGNSDYNRDELLWNEAKLIKDEYPAEFLEGMIFHLQIYLSISLFHSYKIFVDFSDYPSKPTIGISEDLTKELGKSLEDTLYFYRHWDEKIPPHVVEIIKELEAVLWQLKNHGKLSKTIDMPLPALRPLPKIAEELK